MSSPDAEGSNALHRSTTPSPARSRLQLPDEDLDKIWAWNHTVPPTISRCIFEDVSRWAKNAPDQLGVQSWDGELTYGEVESFSDRLATHLHASGVASGAPVPLLFEKSRWTVVGVLGIMKASGVFVLTDVSQPTARLQMIVEQTGANLVLSSRKQRDLAVAIAVGAKVVTIPDDILDDDQYPRGRPLPPVSPAWPMYIIFTSGSTGKPKGVVISHENFTSGALPRAEVVGYRPSSRVFDFASYAFDVSIDCMLLTLASGGCLCIPSDADRLDDLGGSILKSGSNMAHMTPSVARLLDPAVIASLQVLGLGGEAVSASDAASWSSRQTNVVIAYGPSECTVGCTFNNEIGESVGIGKGVGAVTWIVNPSDHDELVPVGSVGELLIEGPVVGLGYLNEEEKTAAAFVRDPAWLLAGSRTMDGRGRTGRLYKTGDLVRYEADGRIAFVGRKDQQVKLRGQRVELSEVEHHLRKLLLPPNEQQHVIAEVVSPKGGGAGPTLVAFLAGTSKPPRHGSDDDDGIEPAEHPAGLAAALEEVEARLAEQLPRYMVPAAFVSLTAMPTLVSGKTNRKRIREIGEYFTREELSRSKRPRRGGNELEGPIEISLARLWGNVLGVKLDIAPYSTFFGLGGDSLRAMRLVSVARKSGLLLTVADVFEAPVLRDMAKKTRSKPSGQQTQVEPFCLLKSCSSSDAKTVAAELCDTDVQTIDDMYPCTPLQEALMALSAKVSEAYVAQRVVKLDRMEPAESVMAAFKSAETESPVLRTRIIQLAGEGLVQVVVNRATAWHQGNSLDDYLAEDRDRSMELGMPLVRYAMIMDEKRKEPFFVLTMHHALYDGWSMPLLVNRVNRHFKGEPSPISPPFNSFIHHIQSLDKAESQEYWRRQLSGAMAPQFPSLPFPSYQPQAQTLLEYHVSLSSRPPPNITIATVIRGAWALVASQYSGSRDVVFGETLTGRDIPIPDAQELEGPMITTVPVRVRLDLNVTAEEYLEDIQALMVSQIPHQHFGLQHIRRLSPDAFQACELRTGLVIHPRSDCAAAVTADDDPDQHDSHHLYHHLPASRLVPAGDAEAAREALKFNTYALMLVCSLEAEGRLLVMASFDAEMVETKTMEVALRKFGAVVQHFCESPRTPLRDVNFLTSQEIADLQAQGAAAAGRVEDRFPGAVSLWIVDPADPSRLLPRGGTGELLVASYRGLQLLKVEPPLWFTWSPHAAAQPGPPFLYRTGQMAVWDSRGELSFKKEGQNAPLPIPPSNQPSGKAVAASSKQRLLRKMWSRVLIFEECSISLHDSFFQLGGDSIAAMKLVSEARRSGWLLNVANIFEHRTLYDMSRIMARLLDVAVDVESHIPFSLLDVNEAGCLMQSIKTSLADPTWTVADIIPARPLQRIAVEGTTGLPRYSARYEILSFTTSLDHGTLLSACQELVERNEILRTVFVKHRDQCFAVVLDSLIVSVTEYDIDGGLESFCRQLCHVDCLTRMPLGSSFVKLFLVRHSDGTSALILRISHAQYDEICLPLLLRQLSAFYTDASAPRTLPFSTYAGHVIRNLPRSVDYWRDLLRGSTMTQFRPTIPITERKHYATQMTFDISMRSREITIASLPTAAWALTLARRVGLRDVVYGEVVSGRNTHFVDADLVVGPTWQYVPVRVKFGPDWTGNDLLRHVQDQHIASSAHEGMGLEEIVSLCTDWEGVDWFDSVVHQAVESVNELSFGGHQCTTKTVYPHEEPLREWKIQAFVHGDKITIEVITFQSWSGIAEELVCEVGLALESLVKSPQDRIFAKAQCRVD